MIRAGPIPYKQVDKLNYNRIKMALYATFLTNWYGYRLKKISIGAEKKHVRLEYAQTLLSKLGIGVDTKGLEKLPKDGSFLLISNHRSTIDPLIVELALKDTTLFGHWISKKELYDSFFFGMFTRNGGSILLDRESRQMGGFFSDIKKHVKNGDSIFLFPEGTRNKTEDDLSEFKDGARIIAMKNRLPILPIYIRTNANSVLDDVLNKRPEEPAMITVEIGDLIDYKDRSVALEEAYKRTFDLSL